MSGSSGAENSELVTRQLDRDPSERSGAARVNRNLVLGIGLAFACVASLATGIAMHSVQHHGDTPMFAAAAAAATVKPAAASYPSSEQATDRATAAAAAEAKAEAAAAARERTKTAAAANGDGGESDDNGNPSAPHLNGSGNGTGGGGAGGGQQQQQQPETPAQRVADAEQEAWVLNQTRHISDEESAITADPVVSGGGASARAGTLTSASTTPSSDPSTAPAPDGGTPTSMPTDAPRPTPTSSSISPFAWREVDAIGATIVRNTDSDRPGEVEFMINRDIADTDYSALVLIPRGGIAVGRVTGIDQSTRAVSIEPLKFRVGPGAPWIPLSGNTLDADGNNGVLGHRNTHQWPSLVLTVVGGALSGLNQALQTGSNSVVLTTESRPPVAQEALGGAGSALLTRMNTQAQQAAARPITISIPYGTSVNLQPTEDIPLLPYCDQDTPQSRECQALQYLHELQQKG